MTRKIKNKTSQSPTPTIIGAGITEQWYFTHLRNLFNCRMKIRPRFFGEEDIQSIAKKIEMVLSNDGIAICIFDADVSTWNDVEKKRLVELRKTYEKNKNVVLCDNLPSIEYWFLLHYINTNRHFGTSKAVIKELHKYQPDYDKTESYLKNEKWVADMEANDRLKQACARARKIGTNSESYSNVWKINLLTCWRNSSDFRYDPDLL